MLLQKIKWYSGHEKGLMLKPTPPFKNTLFLAVAGVVQWIEHQPENQRVVGSVPSQGTCLGCRPGPQYRACERQPHIDVSLPLFLLPFHSLKINKIF